jgi:hypothetical protein
VTAPTGSVRPEIDPEQLVREMDRDLDRSGQLVCRQTGKLPKNKSENKDKAKRREKGKRRKKKEMDLSQRGERRGKRELRTKTGMTDISRGTERRQ